MTSVLIIFTRVPVSGLVKNRLIPFLSKEEAAIFQKMMLYDNIITGTRAEYDRIIVAFTPEDARSILIEQIAEISPISKPISYIPQKGSNFDERFHNIIQHAIQMENPEKLVIVGSDDPFITTKIHNETLKKLEKENSVVFGWTRDGGVYLVGLKRGRGYKLDFRNKFSSGVESWLLIDEAKKLGLNIDYIQESSDIDVPSDLLHAYILCMNLKNSSLPYPYYTTTYLESLNFQIVEEGDNRARKLIKGNVKEDK